MLAAARSKLCNKVRLGRCICQKHYIIDVVCVVNCFSEVPSASFGCPRGVMVKAMNCES